MDAPEWRIFQDTDDSCWAASLAAVTGIDYDVLDKDKEKGPSVFMWQSIKDDRILQATLRAMSTKDRKYITLSDWNKALRHAGITLKFRKKHEQGKRAVAVIVDAFELCNGSPKTHACAVDEYGYLWDNNYDSDIDGVHVSELEDACNIVMAGYCIVEVDDV